MNRVVSQMISVSQILDLLQLASHPERVALVDAQRVGALLHQALHELLRYKAREQPEAAVLEWLQVRLSLGVSVHFTTREVCELFGFSPVEAGRVLMRLCRQGKVSRGRQRGEWIATRTPYKAGLAAPLAALLPAGAASAQLEAHTPARIWATPDQQDEAYPAVAMSGMDDILQQLQQDEEHPAVATGGMDDICEVDF